MKLYYEGRLPMQEGVLSLNKGTVQNVFVALCERKTCMNLNGDTVND